MATKPTNSVSSALRRAAAQQATSPAPGTLSVEERIARADAILSPPAPSVGGEATSERTRLSVPLASTRPHPLNARKFYPIDSELEFAAKLASEGQMDAVKAIADPERPGEWLIVDGERRRRALHRNNAPTIEIAILDPNLTPLQLYLLSKSLNETRAEQTDLDNAYSWHALIENGVVPGQRELAEELGISQSTVSRVISLVELPESLLDTMRADPTRFPYRIANELRLLARDKGVDLAIEQASLLLSDDTGAVTVRSLEALRVRPVSKEGERRTRENPNATTRLVVAGKPAGALKLFPSGRLLLELDGLSPELQQQIHDAVSAVVEKSATRE